MNKLFIFTDGACSGNPGLGGYGFVVYKGINLNHIKKNKIAPIDEVSVGTAGHTTNNIMELSAVIEAIKKYKNCEEEIDIYTDSVYVKNGITLWVKKWKELCWRKADKKPIKNLELWKQLDLLVSEKTNTNFFWVKAHSGEFGNEIADALATSAITNKKY